MLVSILLFLMPYCSGMSRSAPKYPRTGYELLGDGVYFGYERLYDPSNPYEWHDWEQSIGSGAESRFCATPSEDPTETQRAKSILLPAAIARERAKLTAIYDAYDLENPDTFRHLRAFYGHRNEARRTDALLGYIVAQGDTEGSRGLDNTYTKIHSIHITGSATEGNWTLLYKILEKADSLEEVIYGGDHFIPERIMKIIDSKPQQVRLTLTIFLDGREEIDIDGDCGPGSYDDRVSDKQPIFDPYQSWTGSESLHSLKATVRFYGGSDDRKTGDLVTKILVTTPNLRHLDLTYEWRGMYNKNPPFGFNFDLPGTIAPLETIKLDGYWPDARSDGHSRRSINTIDRDSMVLLWPWNMLPSTLTKSLDPYTIIRNLGTYQHKAITSYDRSDHTPDNIDMWLERMDWSHVHTFDFKMRRGAEPSGIIKVAPWLPALRNLSLEGVDSKVHTEFLSALPEENLESIHFPDVNAAPLDSFIDAVKRHTNRLHDLDLRYCRSRAGRDCGCTSAYIPISISYLPQLQAVDLNFTSGIAQPASTAGFDYVALVVLQTLSNKKTLELNILPETQDSSSPKIVNPLGPLQIERFLDKLQRYIVDGPRVAYKPSDSQHEHFAFMGLLQDGHKEVRDLFADLDWRKVPWSRDLEVKALRPLKTLWLYFGPYEDEGHVNGSKNGHRRLLVKVWRCWYDETASDDTEEFSCKGELWSTTPAWHKDRDQQRSWGEVVDTWVMDRRRKV